MKTKWSIDHAPRKWNHFEKDVFPAFGNTPIKNITAREILGLLEKIQARGAIAVAHRIKGLLGRLFMTLSSIFISSIKVDAAIFDLKSRAALNRILEEIGYRLLTTIWRFG